MLALSCLATFQAAAADEAPEVSPATEEWFEREVRPILAERCISCHTSSLEQPKGGLKLDTREHLLAGGDSGPGMVPGKAAESLIIQAIRREGLEMPPEKPLAAAEVATLTKWVELGAPWPARRAATLAKGADWLVQRAETHWAWQPVSDPIPPSADQDKQFPSQSIDSFIYDKLRTVGVEASGPASPEVMARRLSYDLIGLPASQDLVELLSGPAADEAYRRAVDRLLASPQFGVTWGRHWLDLIRYSETLGHEFDYPVRHAWRYRDAVVDSLNQDVSYSQFVREHIAGDTLPPRRHPVDQANQALALTTWWWMGEGLHAPVDVLFDEAGRVDNQIDVFSKAFMGLTIACARCHDHKFDALSMKDYTSLVGIIQSSRRTYALDDPGDRIHRQNQLVVGELAKLDEQVRNTCNAASREQLKTDMQEFVRSLLGKYRADPEGTKAAVQHSHPLFPLRALAERPAEEAGPRLKQLRDELAGLNRSYQQWLDQSPLVADFAAGLPQGWYAESVDPIITEGLNQRGGIDWLADPTPVAAATNALNTARLGKRQQLNLRSPTFELTHPMVAVKMRGRNVVSSVVVDNYFMNEFTGLLFGDMRKGIDQPSGIGWVMHGGDLKKYIGHPTYVSIEDDEQGWMELAEVRQCKQPPPVQPSDAALSLLQRDYESIDQVIDAVAEELCNAWEQVSSSEKGSTVERAGRAMLLRSSQQESARLGIKLTAWGCDPGKAKEQAERVPSATRYTAIHEGTPRDAKQAVRGNPHRTGEVVPRSNLEALGFDSLMDDSMKEGQGSGRRLLAERLTDARHPLTARVMVNRIWGHLLGQGLLDSPDNFGVLGGAPSHRELLDHLTTDFIRHDWSIKHLVRKICMSDVYRRSSGPSSETQRLKDPDCRLYSRRQVRRLTAEKLRDTLITLSGSLDSATSGESVPVHLTDKMTGRGRPGAAGPLDGKGRRSVFIEIRRNFLDPFLVAFDQPQPATTVGKRNVSNVPAQALGVLNDPLVHEMSSRWAARVVADPSDTETRIQGMFMSALARMPSAEELDECKAWLGQEANDPQLAKDRWTEFAHVMLCSKELLFLQ